MSREHLNQETQDAIFESLETLSHADGYYRWLCSRMRPFIRGRVLEIGAGIGTFAQWGCQLASDYHPTDVDSRVVARLREKFPAAFQWNLFEPFPGDLLYDTIIILNVIEHLEDDLGALKALHRRLAPGGRIIVMVPAMQFLYGSMDRSFGHFRRYNKKMLRRLFTEVPFEFVSEEYVNVAGMFGWFLYGRILKHRTLPQGLTSRFNLVLPFLKIERPLASFAGLSLITVGQK
jgi:SAM-dependent methyltransferase